MKWKKKSNLIKDLIKRRDEVIERAKNAANRTFPEHLMDNTLADLFEWIITPHITKKFKKYKYVAAEDDRGAEQSVIKVMKIREKLNEKKE